MPQQKNPQTLKKRKKDESPQNKSVSQSQTSQVQILAIRTLESHIYKMETQILSQRVVERIQRNKPCKDSAWYKAQSKRSVLTINKLKKKNNY